ncbi:MAG: HK97 gp10 family phage protein [Solirubrobacterales bacterium]
MTDFEDFEKSINNMINSMEDIVSERMGDFLDKVVADLKSTTPKGSGGLAESWGRSDISKEGNIYSTEVGSNLDNAEDFEYGYFTENGELVKGQLTFTNAIAKADKNFEEVVQDILNDIVKESKL